MFDNVSILRTGNRGSFIDLGLLAESLLFYDKVHLLLSRGTMHSLLVDLGAEGFDRLLARPEVRVSFWNENFGVISSSNNGLRAHNFGVFEVGKGGKNKRAETVEEIIERALGKAAATKKRVKSIMSHLSFARIEDTMSPADFTEGARMDLNDPRFVQSALNETLVNLVPQFVRPRDLHFDVLRLSDGSFALSTNLDFAAVNLEYHKAVPVEHSSITPEYLLNFMFDAHAGVFLAGRYMSELVHDPLCASIMKLKYLNLMQKRDSAVSEIDLFQDLHLHGRAIREVINKREKSLDDLYLLLDEAKKFKSWLRDKNPDRSLVKEYFDAVTRETWVDKLPTKSVRWIITTGLGAAVETLYPTGLAIAAAQGVSLADATVLDKMLKGWRPDQFVNGAWSDFVG
ncbi:hypothetical protein [Tardiphaga sp. P5_C7]